MTYIGLQRMGNPTQEYDASAMLRIKLNEIIVPSNKTTHALCPNATVRSPSAFFCLSVPSYGCAPTYRFRLLTNAIFSRFLVLFSCQGKTFRVWESVQLCVTEFPYVEPSFGQNCIFSSTATCPFALPRKVVLNVRNWPHFSLHKTLCYSNAALSWSTTSDLRCFACSGSYDAIRIPGYLCLFMRLFISFDSILYYPCWSFEARRSASFCCTQLLRKWLNSHLFASLMSR